MDTQRIDHLEFYAADADRAAGRICAGFGFRIAGALGPDRYGRRSVLLRQGGVQVLVASARAAAAEVTRHQILLAPCAGRRRPRRRAAGGAGQGRGAAAGGRPDRLE